MDDADLSAVTAAAFDGVAQEAAWLYDALTALLRLEPPLAPDELHRAVCAVVACKDALEAILVRHPDRAALTLPEAELARWGAVFAWGSFGRELEGLGRDGF